MPLELRDAAARARGDIASDLSTFWTGVSSDAQKFGLGVVEEANKWKQKAQETEFRAQAQLAKEMSDQAQSFAEEKQVLTGSHLEAKIRSTNQRQNTIENLSHHRRRQKRRLRASLDCRASTGWSCANWPQM